MSGRSPIMYEPPFGVYAIQSLAIIDTFQDGSVFTLAEAAARLVKMGFRVTTSLPDMVRLMVLGKSLERIGRCEAHVKGGSAIQYKITTHGLDLLADFESEYLMYKEHVLKLIQPKQAKQKDKKPAPPKQELKPGEVTTNDLAKAFVDRYEYLVKELARVKGELSDCREDLQRQVQINTELQDALTKKVSSTIALPE